MSRNKNSRKKGSRVASKNAPRPIRGSRYLEEIGGIEKFKNTRRQARRVWAREDNRY